MKNINKASQRDQKPPLRSGFSAPAGGVRQQQGCLMIKGDTVHERKLSLAEIVKDHLNKLGKNAELVFNQTNSAGHTDRVLVKSDIGIIHLTTTSSNDPNASLVTGGFIEKEQDFIKDKSFICYGWVAKDKRTFIMFVEPKNIGGLEGISKQQITKLRNREFSTVVA